MNWVNRLYDACLARRFPDHQEMFDSPLDYQTTVTVRASDDCAFERQITIWELPGGSIQADVTAVEGESLDEQMKALHLAHLALNPAEVCAQVKIRSFRPTGSDLQKVAEGFQRLKSM